MARKILLSICAVIAIALASTPSYATCSAPGLQGSNGSGSTVGDLAIAGINVISGCSIYVDTISASMVQNGGAAIMETLAVWNNNSCTGTPAHVIQSIALTATDGSTQTWNSPSGFSLPGVASTNMCVGFTASTPNATESVHVTYHFD